MNFAKKLITIFFLLLLPAAGTFFGYNLGRSECRICAPENIDFSLFWESWQALQEKFFDKSGLDNQKMIYGAISGMVDSLGDPYTIFFPPEETKRFEEDVKGSFEGVGMEIDRKNDQLLIISPLEGTPAQKAGLRPGDIILKIGDKDAADLSVEEAINSIRGPKGTEVILTIMRQGWDSPREFKLVRQVIEVPSLKLEFKETEGINIAYVKIYQFSENLTWEFGSAAFSILEKQSNRIIIDLRNNPGGYLEVAQDVAGWFLSKGQTVVIEDFNNGQRKEYQSEGNGLFSDYKVVLLMNKGSASAAEILAGTLRDNRSAKLIGEKSFGKGSVQELERLSDGSSLKITVARWLTPKGQQINGFGLEPDIQAELSEEDIQAQRDPQLDKAIEVIKGL